MELKNRIAVVTGGSNGNLGPIWVRLLKEWGMRVVSIDLPKYDITDLGRLEERRQDILEKGVPFIVINNAAIDPKPSGEGVIWDWWYETIEVNLIGAGNVIRIFVDDMAKAGEGIIVNIGSMLGFVGANYNNYAPGFMKPCAYNSSKAGLLGLTRSVGTYYAKWGVRCVMLALGPVESPAWQPEFREKILAQIPSRRFVTEDDMRAGLRFCIDSPAFNAREVLIDSGYTAL